MSDAEQGGAGRREVAYRLFAAEYEDADFSYSESDEERAPNYVVTPSGARVNRLFVVGVLTEVTQVSDDVLRARVVDPTGPFVIYAGQYQPDALAFIERAEPPTFVAVTGKARTFQPEDSDTVYTSIRPESVNEVDAATRDRWVVNTAEQTLDRVATMARGLAREERGDDLRDALVAGGVDDGLAAGVALAIEHYHTTPTYLAGLRDLALDAARVVAGDREEVEPLAVSPDEEGTASLGDLGDLGDLSATASPAGDATAPDSSAATTDPTDTTAAEPADSSGEPVETGGTAEDRPVEAGSDEETGAGTGSVTAESESTGASAAESIDGDGADTDGVDAGADEDDIGDFDPGEFELDEDEREQIEDEYGTEFETGTEVDDPGEADIDTPDPDELAEQAGDATTDAGAESEAEPEPDAGPAEEPEAEAGPESEAEPEPAGQAESASGSAEDADVDEDADEAGDVDEDETGDVNLPDAVMETMQALDDGDGADRQALIDTVVEETGATAEEVEDAIQDALMDGRCYEPGDGALKPI